MIFLYVALNFIWIPLLKNLNVIICLLGGSVENESNDLTKTDPFPLKIWVERFQLATWWASKLEFSNNGLSWWVPEISCPINKRVCSDGPTQLSKSKSNPRHTVKIIPRLNNPRRCLLYANSSIYQCLALSVLRYAISFSFSFSKIIYIY